MSRLEQQGYVRRERVGDDRRGYLAVLTESGHAKVLTTAPGHADEVRARVFDRLTPAQVAQLDAICSAILRS